MGMEEQRLVYDEFKYNLKKGKLEDFRKQLMESEDKFRLLLKHGHDLTLGTINPEDREYMDDLATFELKLLRDKYTEKFGSGLMDKLSYSIIEEEYTVKKLRALGDIIYIANFVNSPEEAKNLEDILDICMTPGMNIGVHMTGNKRENLGEIISNSGIELTGHNDSGAIVISDSNHVKSTLERNVSFFGEKNPCGVLEGIIRTKAYKCISNTKNNAVIVAIPIQELNDNTPEIIVENLVETEEVISVGEDQVLTTNVSSRKYLNPKYIVGYAEVGVESGKFESFNNNPLYDRSKIELAGQPQSVADLTVQDWEAKFEDWYEDANKNKFQKIQSKVMKFFRDIFKKDRGQRQIADHSVDIDK